METNLSSLHVSSEGIVAGRYSMYMYLFLISQYIVEQIPALNMLDVCTNAPMHGKAFCKEHCDMLERQTVPIPTGLREFLKHCHVTGGLCMFFSQILSMQ